MATTENKQKFNRKFYDQKTKDRIIEAVKSGKQTVQEAARENGVQPYQVFAWIGEKALTDMTANGVQSVPDTESTGGFLQLDASARTDPDLARAIGEWWLRTHTVEPRK